MQKKFAVIWCSEVTPLHYADQMAGIFRREGEQWDIVHPATIDFSQLSIAYDGYVVSGSEKSAVEDVSTPIVSNTIKLLRTIEATSQSPVIGICFGSQVLAVSLGGTVGLNPDQRFRLGVETMQWADNLDTERWPEAEADSTLIASHGECVQQLPPGSTLLARSKTVPHEIFLVGDRFLGIQGHPEMDAALFFEAFDQWHRPFFDDDAWAAVEQEMKLPVHNKSVCALGRRLLDAGTL